jgi:hypothetical protein
MPPTSPPRLSTPRPARAARERQTAEALLGLGHPLVGLFYACHTTADEIVVVAALQVAGVVLLGASAQERRGVDVVQICRWGETWAVLAPSSRRSVAGMSARLPDSRRGYVDAWRPEDLGLRAVARGADPDRSTRALPPLSAWCTCSEARLTGPTRDAPSSYPPAWTHCATPARSHATSTRWRAWRRLRFWPARTWRSRFSRSGVEDVRRSTRCYLSASGARAFAEEEPVGVDEVSGGEQHAKGPPDDRDLEPVAVGRRVVDGEAVRVALPRR